jgi:hypothetical protein
MRQMPRAAEKPPKMGSQQLDGWINVTCRTLAAIAGDTNGTFDHKPVAAVRQFYISAKAWLWVS